MDYSKKSKKYRYLGYTWMSVPEHWKPVVLEVFKEMDKYRPKLMPRFLLCFLHYLATGGSVVRVKYWWAYNLMKKTYPYTITQIKDKYGTLRIYGSFNEHIQKVIDDAENKCLNICESCGSKESVELIGVGWVYCLCKKCREAKLKNKTNEKQ